MCGAVICYKINHTATLQEMIKMNNIRLENHGLGKQITFEYKLSMVIKHQLIKMDLGIGHLIFGVNAYTTMIKTWDALVVHFERQIYIVFVQIWAFS